MTGRQHDWPALQAQFLAYRSGDGAVTRPLYAALAELLQRYYRVRTGVAQDADDLAQACLLKLHLARDRYDPTHTLKTWVYAIAGRCLIDHWRGRGRRREDADAEAGELAPDEHLAHDLRLEYSETLQEALATLKPLDRQIVYLYGVEELAMAEVAALVGLSVGAVKVRAHRSYVKLRALIAPAAAP